MDRFCLLYVYLLLHFVDMRVAKSQLLCIQLSLTNDLRKKLHTMYMFVNHSMLVSCWT